MQQIPSFWVVIPAAGSGHRFNAAVPKQYALVQQKTILEHSVDLFLDQPWIKQITLCIAPEDTFFPQLPLAHHTHIRCVQGGQTRAHSVLNALQDLTQQAHPLDWVLVHDAVRPCLHPADLNRLVETLLTDEVGGILAAPVIDTIKSVKAGAMQTVSRDHLWRALTPQMFRFEKLKKALMYCLDNHLTVTDEASALEYHGHNAQVVEAKFANPKLTLACDLPLITSILNQKRNEVILT